MTTLMDLRCFLCKDHITYNNNDKTDFTEHMNNEHLVDFGIDFLLASCLMEQEEREAIKDVIGDKFQIGDKFNDPEDLEDDIYADLQDITVEHFPPQMTLSEQNDVSKSLVDELVGDDEMGPLAWTEDNFSILESILSQDIIRENKQHKLSMPTPIETQEGFPCPECGKVFRSAGNVKYHFVDIHQPGEFPCLGCHKMFTSKNKMSSHYSRYCNSSRPTIKRRKLSDVKNEEKATSSASIEITAIH
eukprot:GFUD01021546.1.p1 GENE.GFUD01021546.1~~GFUD01021546.1.p1  ORF type:complete len:246 (+),score=62.66 GFUD01021546.1:43-780(+)